MADDARSSDLTTTTPAVDVQATFCATLVDEWIRRGVRHAVISPGSRSTPLALAIAARTELAVHVVHDERAAAFTALGLGVGAGLGGVDERTPALLLCTSGTASANYLPAIAEAGLSQIPMLVLTADRPPELRGVGAPQTIDQIELYGTHVRWFHDPGVPEAATSTSWREVAAQAKAATETGPVHLNLPFREPLVGTPCALPNAPFGSTTSAAEPQPGESTQSCPPSVERTRGLILVGGEHATQRRDIRRLHERTGWPIVADAQSGMRDIASVAYIDALLRIDRFATLQHPDVVVRVGRPSTSKVLAQLTASAEVTLIQVGGPGRIDPGNNVAARCTIDDVIAAAAAITPDPSWLASWHTADEAARCAIDAAFASADRLNEPLVARVLADHVDDRSLVTVSSSMPIRDLEWFGGSNARAYANRGANGIDGVIATALGRTLGADGSPPSFVLIGDLAFVHDSNALVASVPRGVDLRIVVVDNGGGGIFSFLPQQELLGHDRFEQLFGTPLGTDVLTLASAHGLPTTDVVTVGELVDQLEQPGPWVCRVRSDRAANVAVHRALNEAVAGAVTATIAPPS
ncbi:MAG: 2-succinyl-5-enolpyruvyl-6-hydroxy-3-cyclohexene-1-carboxylic-acid synthase [Ilumatobacter sp.]